MKPGLEIKKLSINHVHVSIKSNFDRRSSVTMKLLNRLEQILLKTKYIIVSNQIFSFYLIIFTFPENFELQ